MGRISTDLSTLDLDENEAIWHAFVKGEQVVLIA